MRNCSSYFLAGPKVENCSKISQGVGQAGTEKPEKMQTWIPDKNVGNDAAAPE